MSSSSWARRRQTIYGGGVVLIVLSILIPIIFFSTNEAPTCFDNKRNQGETAPDKGGPCVLLDERFVQKYSVLWSRAFLIKDGLYNAVAYIENPNREAGMKEVQYQFKLYDDENIIIAEKFGRTPIFPGKVFPVFEGRIYTGSRIPVRTVFSFLNEGIWIKTEDETKGIIISNEQVSVLDTTPRVDALVKNTNIVPVRDIIFTVVLFDSQGNAIAASRTIVDNIDPEEQQNIAFTWPQPFTGGVAKISIIPSILDKRRRRD